MSIPLLATNTTQLCRVVKALYDAAPGYTYLQNFLSYANTNGLNATVNALASNFSSQTNAQLSATICTNLGLTGTAYTAGVDYLTAQFNATTAANRGTVINTAMNALANLSGDATFGTAASAFNASVARAESYSTNESNTSTDLATLQSADEVSSTTSFTLSTNAETTNGTGGNDVFQSVATDTTATLNTGDIINGGLGNDTLEITAGGATAGPALNSVETVSIKMISASVFDAIQWSGTTTVKINNESIAGSAIDLTLQNLADNVTIELADANPVTVGYLDASSGDIGLLSLQSMEGATTAASRVAATFNGVSGIAISMSGQNRALIEGDILKTVTISGAGSGSLSFDGMTSINMAAFSGTSTITISAASDVTIVGGQGNDTFAFGATLGSNDSVDGGSGTDTLTVTTEDSITMRNITGIETLGLTMSASQTGTINVSGIGSLSTVNLIAGTSSNVTLRALNNEAVVNVSGLAGASHSFVTLSYLETATSGTVNLHSTGAYQMDTLAVSGAGLTEIDMSVGASAALVTTVSSAHFENSIDTLNLSARTGSGDSVFSFVHASGLKNLNITANKSADVTVGFLNASSLTSVNLLGNNANIDLADASLGLNTGSQTISISNSTGSEIAMFGITAKLNSDTTYSITVGEGAAVSAVGFVGIAAATATTNVDLDATIAASGRLHIANLHVTQAAGNSYGTIEPMTITVGASGALIADSIAADSIGNISLNLGGGATATFGGMTARTIGDITITGSGSGVVFNDIVGASATLTIGNVSVADGNRQVSLDLIASAIASSKITVGDMTIAGDAFTATLAGASAARIGDITLTGSGGAITLAAGVSGTIGEISIAGSSQFSIALGSANTTFDSYETVGHAGTAILNMSSNFVTESDILLGSGTNYLYFGQAGAEVTLSANTGRDIMVFNHSADVVTNHAIISNFEWGASTDQIAIDASDVNLGVGTAGSVVSTNGSALTVLNISGTAGRTATQGVEVIVFSSATFTDVADMVSSISTNGDFAIYGEGVSAGAALGIGTAGAALILWSNGDDSYLTLIETLASSIDESVIFSATNSYANLAVFEGVDITSAAFTGLTYSDKFITL